MQIIVNGRPAKVDGRHTYISYEDVVLLASPHRFQTPNGLHPEWIYSITYTRGHPHRPEGILSPGGKVRQCAEMRFRVARTGQS